MDFFWLNSSGNIINSLGHDHISSIVDQPEIFGINRKTITDAYKRFKEKTGTEGKAREYVMTIVMKKGWIRVRDKDSYWIFETWNLTDEQKNSIYEFVLTNKQVGKFDTVIVTQIDNNVVHKYEDKKQFRKTFMTDGVNLW